MENKKRAVRVGGKLKITIREVVGDFISGSHGKNISETGLCIPLTYSIPVGSLLEIKIRFDELKASVKAIGRVAWVVNRNDKEFPAEAGLELLNLGSVERNILRDYIAHSAAKGGAQGIRWIG